MGLALTVLICTHNRAALLQRVLASLNAAKRPDCLVEILVAANACTDNTVAQLLAYQARQACEGWISLRLIEVPTPGKSFALNQAIPLIASELTAFVDDDHRVDSNYLVAIEEAAKTWPEAGLYCGRILPDWDGSEPLWVHDEGDYKIYPLPVPRYEIGTTPRRVGIEEGPIPGGGNIIARRDVLTKGGQFSTELGPHGHDLGGGEDTEYVLRAMARGVICQYAPTILQRHYVDVERLRLSYLLKKSYQRTRATARIHGDGKVPRYMWRKLTEYALQGFISLTPTRRRFYLMRIAAALGEIRGRVESSHRGRGLDLSPDLLFWLLSAALTCALCLAAIAWVLSDVRWSDLLPLGSIATLGTIGLLAKSIVDFSQTGPRVQGDVRIYYRQYTWYAVARLGLWVFGLMFATGGAGVLAYYALHVVAISAWSPVAAAFAAALGIGTAFALQFAKKLRFNPGLLVASMHYRASRFYALWRTLTPARLRWIEFSLLACLLTLAATTFVQLMAGGNQREAVAFACAVVAPMCFLFWTAWQPEARPPARRRLSETKGAPNLVLIGSDTLRADRLGILGYHRSLTPNIDALADKGTLFSHCYVPCARTAPSLISMFTGTWPHTHGVRDNFIAQSQARLRVDALPTLLKRVGYRTATISDWCGSDLGKFSFGFDRADVPDDQWNLKYLIRQGPKDLRLFVSLFTHNRLGRLLLPEVFYLGGVPQTHDMGRRARRMLSRLAEGESPFLLNVFYSTTHPPFASEWPWYSRFSDPAYDGESKFAMARLTDPFEIIRRQGEAKEEFDLDQILDLYDGCVGEFDDEVGKLLRHIDACGIGENTIVVVYSDHGMEFFEHDTWGQGNSAVGDFSPRIPLLIRDPRTPGRGNIDHVVRSIDLAPTLLELVGAPRGPDVEGVSLVGSLGPQKTCPQLDAFNETGMWITDIPGLPETHLRYPNLFDMVDVPDPATGTLAIKSQYCSIMLRAKDRMIRRGRWKLVYQPLESGHLLRLFDLATDPGCRIDVSDKNPEIAVELQRALLSWIVEKQTEH